MIKNSYTHTITNTDRIAHLRHIDSIAAISFWEQACKAAGRDLSTYDVLTLLRACGKQATTVAAFQLVTASSRGAQLKNNVNTGVISARYASTVPTLATRNSIFKPETAISNNHATKCKSELAEEHNLTTTEADELYNLLEKVRPLKFARSKQLSDYIVRNSLGYKYPNIAGIVRMEDGGTEWNFNGGFPPKIYAIICDELALGNQGTRARVVGFESYKQMQSSRTYSIF